MEGNNLVIVHGVQKGDDLSAVRGPEQMANALREYVAERAEFDAAFPAYEHLNDEAQSSLRTISKLILSRLLAPVFLFGPSNRVTYFVSKAAVIGFMAESSSLIGSKCFALSTPAFTALSYALSGIGSHPPKTMSSRPASPMKSLMRGVRLSVR